MRSAGGFRRVFVGTRARRIFWSFVVLAALFVVTYALVLDATGRRGY